MSIQLTQEQVAVQDELVERLAKTWLYYLAAGIIGVLLGFVVLAWRTETLYAVAYFAGAAFLFVGLVRFAEALLLQSRRWLSLAMAVVFLATGVMMVAWPHITLFIAALLIALNFVLWGVLELIVSLSNTSTRFWWMGVIAAVVSFVIAIWTVRHPGNALNVLTILVGIWIMLWGVTEMLAALAARHAKRDWEEIRGLVA
jgi:uncharacterized membrane protein HdeD (DUF308 family)